MSDAPQNQAESLVPVTSLEEFFRDSVDAALAANHVSVECDTSRYVVQLLTLFARADACYDPAAGGNGHRPLALMLAEAVQAQGAEERRVALQRLGDVALFTAGFFAEALQRRAVGIDYYVNMGGGAYLTLAAAPATARGRALSEVFAELGAKFLDLVDVLAEVRAAASGHSDQDVLCLYEAWQRTGSRRAGRRLRQAGIEPVGTPVLARAH